VKSKREHPLYFLSRKTLAGVTKCVEEITCFLGGVELRNFLACLSIFEITSVVMELL